MGEHVIKTYCKQQKVIALSSAEAELYAMVAASAETLALQAYANDLGIELGCELYCDSAAALGIAQRAGIGKVRHLRTQGLWIQEVRVSGRIAYKKVLGEKNPADLLTKHMSADLSGRHLACLNMDLSGGRAEAAPTLDSLVTAWYTGPRRRGNHRVSFSDKISYQPVPAEGRQRPTPARGAGATVTTEMHIDQVDVQEKMDHIHGKISIGHEVIYGDGSSGVRLVARGARWADAEDSDDDVLRTQPCALDSKPPARQQQPEILSLETAQGAEAPYSFRAHSSISFRAHSSNRRGRPELTRAPPRQPRAHSSRGDSFANIGQSHNRGMLSVVGMRRESGPTRLSPSACRLCDRPNSRSTESHHVFSLASAALRASAAGGAQTHGRIHTRVHTQACSWHVRSTHDTCV